MVMGAKEKWSKTRSFSGYFSRRIRLSRKRFIQK
jgi:hypothetical protein